MFRKCQNRCPCKSKIVRHFIFLVGHDSNKLFCVKQFKRFTIFMCGCVSMDISLSVAKGYPRLNIEQLDVIIFNYTNVDEK